MPSTALLSNPVLSTEPVRIFTHIVTLINRLTGEEKSLTIETLTDRFTDVMFEITHQKAINKLQGFEIFEILDCNEPF